MYREVKVQQGGQSGGGHERYQKDDHSLGDMGVGFIPPMNLDEGFQYIM